MAKKVAGKGSKTTLWIIIISLVVGVGIIFWAYQSAKSPEAGISAGSGRLVAEAETYDFGQVSMAKGLVDYEFVLSNNSGAAVKVGAVETSCMCTIAYLRVNDGKEVGPFEMPGHGPSRPANLIVEPGQKLIVRTVFDPSAHGPAGVGAVERAVIMDVGQPEPLVLSFKAIVTP